MLLAEEPMHGYQLMQAIADRSGGRWTPSPGAIYPTINQLEDEGLVTVTAEAGRKLDTLSDSGREYVEAVARRPPTRSPDSPARKPPPTCADCSRSCTQPLDRSPAVVRSSSAPRPPRSWPKPAAPSTYCSPTPR